MEEFTFNYDSEVSLSTLANIHYQSTEQLSTIVVHSPINTYKTLEWMVCKLCYIFFGWENIRKIEQ